MSFLKNNKTAALVLGGSALALTAGVVIYLKSKSATKVIVQEVKEEQTQENTTTVEEEDHDRVKRGVRHNKQQQETPVVEDQQSVNQQLDREQDLSVKTKTSIASSRVKVQFLDGSDSYDFATITAILESSLDYIGQEYIAYTQKNREERRKVRTNDSDRYKELVLEYNAQIEKFILTAQDQLLADVNIDKEQFEKSVNSLIQNGYYQQLYMVQSAMRQKISEKLPRTKQVSKEQIKEIIQYQLEILVNQKEIFIAMISQLQFVPDIAELIPFVLNTMIQDMIYDKFSIEEEDQTSQMSAQDLIDDPDMHSLLKQIEEAMLNMMNSLGLNYIDEEQEIEEIERLREMGQYSEN